jgi:hypothetical protein
VAGVTTVEAVAPGRSAVSPRWAVVFGLAGIALLPWIVLLGIEQPRVAAVDDLPIAAGGAIAAIAVGLLLTAVLTVAGSALRSVTAGATGALAVCAGFFHVATGTASDPRAAAFATVVLLVPVAVLCGVVARSAVRERGDRSRASARLVALVLVLAAIATVVVWWRSASAAFPAHSAEHLKLVWTVLDVAEAGTLLATAVTLRRRPALVPVVASAAGALLCCDVWFNVVGAVGEARAEAVPMAFVSIPLAVAAFAVAVRSALSVAD